MVPNIRQKVYNNNTWWHLPVSPGEMIEITVKHIFRIFSFFASGWIFSESHKMHTFRVCVAVL
jgi:hypothetical protein